jgi:hypothetical protein
LKLGTGLQASPGSREIGLAIIAHDGLSTQRQFFREVNRYVGLEFDSTSDSLTCAKPPSHIALKA